MFFDSLYYEVLLMYLRRLKDLREEHDMTQQNVGDILHCNRKVYGRYERGQAEIPASMLVILAKYYRVNLDYIYGLSDIKDIDRWNK